MATDRYLDLAKLQAQKSTIANKHGAVLVKSGKIVSTGYNTNRSRFVGFNNTNYYSYHDEMIALLNAIPSSKKHQLYRLPNQRILRV